MRIGDLYCGLCTTHFPPETKGGHTIFGLPVCEACANTFATCVKCGRYMETHQEGYGQGQCILCAPSQSRRKFFGVRKHPSTLGLEALDRECADRIAREK